ncbi:MAG: hypothetical protein J6A21_03935 [Lentisphaeria bacterium]|nr:hypothetical protein [Lentisphaeria bacterium]
MGKLLDPNPDFYEIRKEYPSVFRKTSYGCFAGFEKAAFGNVEIEIDAEEDEEATLLLGEMYDPFYERIHRRPLRNVRNMTITIPVKKGKRTYTPVIPSWTGRLKSPTGWEIAPFRYAELTCKGKVSPCGIARNSVFGRIPENASLFRCSNPMLERVWEFCKYSLRATTLFGCFIDGERERLPYEADAFVTALSYYAVSPDFDIVRRTIDYLMENPTWPTEYILLMPILARDYLLYTGDAETVKNWFPLLKEKLLIPFTFEGVLIDMRRAHSTWSDEEIMKLTHLDAHCAHWMRDIVDWPPDERDHYNFGDVVTPPDQAWRKGAAMHGVEIAPPSFVPNAFQAAANDSYAFLAEFFGYREEAAFHRDRAEKIRTELRKTMHSTHEPFGLFVDHPGCYGGACMTDAVSLWAKIAEEENRALIADRLARRGMRCSVYGASYLLEDLFDNDLPGEALKLMAETSGYRSWATMLNQGATITKEAWDDSKEGLDWNHSWAAVPLHAVSRGLFGIRPAEPGFASFTVRPQLAFLEYAQGEQPTVKGPVRLEIRRRKAMEEEAEMVLEVPEGTKALVSFGETELEAGPGKHLVKGKLPLE